MFTGKGLLAIIGFGLLVTALLAGILIYRPFSGLKRADGPIPPTLFTPLGTPASVQAPLAHTPLPTASPSSLAPTPAPTPTLTTPIPPLKPSPALQPEGQLVTLTLSQERANAFLREGIAQRGVPGQNQFALGMAEDKLTISGQATIGEYEVSTPGVGVVFDGLKATLEGPVQVSGLRLSLRGDARLNVERGQLSMAILRLSVGRIPLPERERQSLERIINEQFSALKLDLPAHLVEVRLQEGELTIIGRNP